MIPEHCHQHLAHISPPRRRKTNSSCEKLPCSLWPGEFERDWAVSRLNRDLKAEKPATVSLGGHSSGDEGQGLVRRGESEPMPAVEFIVRIGAPQELRQQPLAPSCQCFGLNVQTTGKSGINTP